jgi:hypothetical protein
MGIQPPTMGLLMFFVSYIVDIVDIMDINISQLYIYSMGLLMVFEFSHLAINW